MVTAKYRIKDELVYYINSSNLKSKIFYLTLEIVNICSFVRTGLNALQGDSLQDEPFPSTLRSLDRKGRVNPFPSTLSLKTKFRVNPALWHGWEPKP